MPMPPMPNLILYNEHGQDTQAQRKSCTVHLTDNIAPALTKTDAIASAVVLHNKQTCRLMRLSNTPDGCDYSVDGDVKHARSR